MTWGEFKEAMNKQVKDDDKIWYIDVGECGELTIKHDPDMGVAVSD